MTQGKDDLPSLDDIFADPLMADVQPAAELKYVKPASQRTDMDYSAELVPCKDFENFTPIFVTLRNDIKTGHRKTRRIQKGKEIDPIEGDFFIRKAQLLYIAERTEQTSRLGTRSSRLRIIFENGMESNPLRASFRKSLIDDKTARFITRRGIGPIGQSFEDNDPNFSGTIYVLETLSDDPNIKTLRHKMVKIGVTSQRVDRRIADARNDPTFLNAPVKVLRTYTLKNLSRMKIEHLIHAFFDRARVELSVPDKMGHHTRPKEWFYVKVECVSQAAHLIKEYGTDLLSKFVFDPVNQQILRKG